MTEDDRIINGFCFEFIDYDYDGRNFRDIEKRIRITFYLKLNRPDLPLSESRDCNTIDIYPTFYYNTKEHTLKLSNSRFDLNIKTAFSHLLPSHVDILEYLESFIPVFLEVAEQIRALKSFGPSHSFSFYGYTENPVLLLNAFNNENKPEYKHRGITKDGIITDYIYKEYDYSSEEFDPDKFARSHCPCNIEAISKERLLGKVDIKRKCKYIYLFYLFDKLIEESKKLQNYIDSVNQPLIESLDFPISLENDHYCSFPFRLNQEIKYK